MRKKAGNQPLDPAKVQKILELSALGQRRNAVAKTVGVGNGTVSKVCANHILADKKLGTMDWRDTSKWLTEGQQIRHKASLSQDTAEVTLGDGKTPIILATLSDMHIGSVGADHKLLEQFTDEIIKTPNLFVALLGDYAEFAVALRSVAEVCGQLLSPDLQLKFVESWLEEIAPKVAWALHDNHLSARSEKNIGIDMNARVFGKKVVYHGNIGHTTVNVGPQSYIIASAHKFRGGSMLNPAHACMRYLRMEAPFCEIAMMGDTHVPMATKYREGHATRVAVNTGNLHLHSGYAKRNFSLAQHPYFPCLVLWPDEHNAMPFWSVADALKCLKYDKWPR